jgi:type VI secretion system protein ImpA
MDPRWNSLMEPLTGSNPCGEDLSFSPEFDQIQELRREDDPAADYGEWQSSLKQADWPAVVESSAALLRTRSKDLRVAAWLTEGLVKTTGLAGLADGLEMTARLIACFGPALYPPAEASDQEQRIGAVTWLVTRMAHLVRQVPLSACQGSDFSLNDHGSAQLLQAQLQRQAESVPNLESRVTLEKISAAVRKTDRGLFVQWVGDVERCNAALVHLENECDMLFGADGPTFSPLMESMEAVRLLLQSIMRELGLDAEDGATGGNAIAPTEPAAISSGPIGSREQALAQLRQVAAYFRNTEPHSPVAYLADKAAHWGRMPLHAWLRSVVKDSGSLSHIEELLGLQGEGET